VGGTRKLVFSENTVVPGGNSITILSRGNSKPGFEVYPNLAPKAISSDAKLSEANVESTSVSAFVVTLPEWSFPVKSTRFGEKKFSLKLPDLTLGLNDVFLQIDYTGDTAMGFMNGKLVVDEFYKNMPWDIGLRNLLSIDSSREMVFYIRPLYKNATYLKDLNQESLPDFGKAKSLLKVNSLKFIPEYKAIIKFK
jgi:hypothetical protein